MDFDQERRFWPKVDAADLQGCWEWRAARSKGYGVFTIKGRNFLAHRLTYSMFVGELISGLEIDHLCRNRGCVNPAHLEQVTHAENCLRADGTPAINARKTHCIKGHKLDEKNTYIQTTYARPRRLCRKCKAANQAAYARRQAALLPKF